MLVDCKSCGLSFDVTLLECIDCAAPVVLTKDEKRQACTDLIWRWAHEGKTADEIRDDLLEAQVFTKGESREIVELVKQMQETIHERESVSTLAIILLIGLGALALHLKLNGVPLVLWAPIIGVILVFMLYMELSTRHRLEDGV